MTEPLPRPHPRVQTFFSGESRTHQSFADEVNINTIMAKYAARGILDHIQAHGGRYENLPDALDYHENMNLMIAADEAFASLPAAIRSRFDNHPGDFLEFIKDPDNQDEINEMGLGVQELVTDEDHPHSDHHPTGDEPDAPDD